MSVANKFQLTDQRIESFFPMPSPREILQVLPNNSEAHVDQSRNEVKSILDKKDDRLLVVVGPCSVHDFDGAVEYGTHLAKAASNLVDDLFIVMRVYFEKPRTSIGWKGLINDPNLDGSADINQGLKTARSLLCAINEMGLPCGTEVLDTVIPQYICDLMSWAAIGARTTESQIHRQLASGLSMPIGFKNGTDGGVLVAAAAAIAASKSHCFPAINQEGECVIAKTMGNEDTHVILRGGSHGPNYTDEYVAKTLAQLKSDNLPERLMIDCSHANSSKDYKNQPIVAADVGQQIIDGNSSIIGLMIESNLVEGNQKLVVGKELTYGQSITDGCIGWEQTEEVLEKLAKAVQQRRKKV